MNKLALSGVVMRLEPLRYTPAGLPILNFVLQHNAENTEAGMTRKVNCEINAVIVGDLAKSLILQGAQIKASGFIAQRSIKSTQLVFHIQRIERI